ncbi:DUF6415 family natural product biosynthesis protein [Streptomyces phaeofaciens]|uniref:DUF6415 family natural product biosynthesis protein n=1 Tax=Streptomyces phaeofaciens TaxID=68254 RepID=UPI0036946604
MALSRRHRFPRARSSVGAARAFALRTLTEWGYEDRHDDVRLCVSELATNALLHGVPPGREFGLELDADGALIRVAVRDSGGGCPELAQWSAEECRGRGLRLVVSLADDFGVTVHDPGKTVWAAFRFGSTAAVGRQGKEARGAGGSGETGDQPSPTATPMVRAAASWFLAQEALPRHQTVKLLGDDFRAHLALLIPKVEGLAAGSAGGGMRAMLALAGVEEARRRLALAERPGLRGEVERVKWLARSVMVLRGHCDELADGVRPASG